jgi:hypothetical protein
VRPGVVLEHHVVLADRVRFLLRGQRHLRSRGSRSRSPSLLRGDSRLRCPPLTRRLLTPISPGRSRRPGRLSTSGRPPSTGPTSPRRRTRHRPVLPRILRRYVVLRIRRLLQGNRPTTITPLPRTSSPTRADNPTCVPRRLAARLTASGLISTRTPRPATRTGPGLAGPPTTGPRLRTSRRRGTNATRHATGTRAIRTRATDSRTTRSRSASPRPRAQTTSTRPCTRSASAGPSARPVSTRPHA